MIGVKDAYTTKEMMTLLELGAESSVTRRAKRESWSSRPREGRGGGNEWLVESMPEDVRLTIAKYEVAEASSKLSRPGLECSFGEKDSSRPVLPSGLTKLPEWQQDRADVRATIVRIYEGWQAAAGLTKSRGRMLFCEGYNAGDDDIPIPGWVREAIPHVSPNSIYNWQKAIAKKGLAGVGGKYGRHRRGSGIIDRNEAMQTLLLGLLFDRPSISAAMVMEAIKARFPKKERPSMRTLLRWLSAWRNENEQLLMAIQSPDQWRSKYQAASGNASEYIIRPNQVWEFDSTPTDVILADGKRHTIIGIIDVYTRRLTFHLSRTSSSAGVAAATRKAIMNWGVPEVAKTDNGSDYVSRHMRRVFLDLGIEQILCPPFSPEKKPHIERSFKTFLHSLCELLGGYVGHSVAERKQIESRQSFADRMMNKDQAPVTFGRLTPDEFQDICTQWTENMYAHKPHDGIGLKTPFEMASSWSGPLRTIQNDRALDVLLLPAAGADGWRTVGKKGLRVDGGHYDHSYLGGMEGQRVRVLLDDADFGSVYVFREAEDGSPEFLCKAMDMSRTGIDRAEVAMERKRRQKRIIAEGKKAMRKASKEANTGDIVQDILRYHAEEAGKLTSLPRPTEVHETAALEQAGRAATVGKAPKVQTTLAQEEKRKALVEELSAQGKVVEIPRDLKRERYKRALKLEEAQQAGLALSAEDEKWLAGYQGHPEYRTMRKMIEDFGMAAIN